MKKIYSILTLTLILTMSACTKDFADINTNKNVPTAVTPDLLISGVIKSAVNEQVGQAWGTGNLLVQYTAKIQFVNEDRYLWGEKNGIWNNVYSNMRNVENVIDLASNGAIVQQNYLGVALVLKSWLYSLATDAYGDIPYSDAIKAKKSSNYLPKYDAQEQIYIGLLADLKRANSILGTSNEPIAGDILFNGSVIKWKKLANSLRLRLLMRLSKKKDVKAEMQEIIGNSTLYPIMSSNADNAELKYLADVPANQWPLYGSRVGSFDEIRVSKTLSDRLNAINDPRLNVFGRPSQKSVAAGSPKIEGIPNGLGDVAALNFNSGPQGVSRVGYTYACLVCNDQGQTPPLSNVARGIIMNFSEVQFILAEAVEKALVTSTVSAETFYTEGIKSNFDYYKEMVPASYALNVTPASSYYNQQAIVYTGTSQQKLEKIAFQKWIALMFTGLESWYDWRRTGMPEIVPGVDNLNNNLVPLRFIYPLSEQALNATNRAAAVSRQGTDDINTKMWIIK